jgi:NADH-quinone oxidoreductase subunit C
MLSDITKEQEIVNNLKDKFGDRIIEAKVQSARRVFVTIDSKSLIEVTKFLAKEKDYTHVATISGLDLVKNLAVIYHLREYHSKEQFITLSLKVEVAKDKPKLPTIIKIIPGAELYEREVHDLFGIVFEGHPDLSPLILPEHWPSGVYPLRKEYKLEDIKAKIEKVKK